MAGLATAGPPPAVVGLSGGGTTIAAVQGGWGHGKTGLAFPGSN